MEETRPPGALAMPKDGQIGRRDHDILLEIFNLLKDQSSCSARPLHHEALVLECVAAVAITAETMLVKSG